MNRLGIGDQERRQLREDLRKVNYFSDLAWVDFNEVVNRTQFFTCKAGETLFKQGDEADTLFVIYEGEVEVRHKEGLFKRSKPIERLSAGHFFGEMALIDGSRRTATVKAATAAKLFVLRRQEVDEMMLENPAFRKHMMAMAETRKFINTRRAEKKAA